MKLGINRPGREAAIRNKRQHEENWHKKFAWLPTIVDETDKSYAVVWGETYMRKLRENMMIYDSRKKMKKHWRSMSKTEYLKQKLAGTLEPRHLKDSEDMAMAQTQQAPSTIGKSQNRSAGASMGKAAGQVLKYNGVNYNWVSGDDLE